MWCWRHLSLNIVRVTMSLENIQNQHKYISSPKDGRGVIISRLLRDNIDDIFNGAGILHKRPLTAVYKHRTCENVFKFAYHTAAVRPCITWKHVLTYYYIEPKCRGTANRRLKAEIVKRKIKCVSYHNVIKFCSDQNITIDALNEMAECALYGEGTCSGIISKLESAQRNC